jgi:deazaflavin-dependent oxidoreductase (nitroreductase family)
MEHLETAAFCYLTTIGRVTGREHTIEIWFAHHRGTVYMLSGGGDRSDWVRNIDRTARVTVGVAGTLLPGTGRIVWDEAEADRARRLVFAKYQPGYGGDLTEWRDTALPVAVDLA